MAIRRGLIRYTAPFPLPIQPPLLRAQPLLDDKPLLDSAETGDLVSIYLEPYESLDPTLVTDKSQSRSTSGVRQTRWFSEEDGWLLKLRNVEQVTDPDKYDAAAVYLALNKALNRGGVIQWYPDFANDPTAYYSCIMEGDAKPPSRFRKLDSWFFEFNLVILPDIQVISTVPPFS